MSFGYHERPHISFNSRTREGCDSYMYRKIHGTEFQFTHPRGVRCLIVAAIDALNVSIHAPARGAIFGEKRSKKNDCFNSRTREGCDLHCRTNHSDCMFQFTHPRGVR